MSCRFFLFASILIFREIYFEVHSFHNPSLGDIPDRKAAVISFPDDENDYFLRILHCSSLGSYHRLKREFTRRLHRFQTFKKDEAKNSWSLKSVSDGGGQTPALRRLTSLVLPGQLVKHLPLCLSDMANIIHAPSVSAKIPQADSLNRGPQGRHT